MVFELRHRLKSYAPRCYHRGMKRIIAVLLILAASTASASVVDQATGPALDRTLDQCRQVARDTGATQSGCRAYVRQGASSLQSQFFGHESADYWSTCIERNPLYAHRGIDYQAVVECAKYAQDHGSLKGAFRFSHKRYH